jgi:hypothetical protein
MKTNLPDETICCFLRLGLVTGLIERQAVINWADRQILERPVPEEFIIELALSSRQPYSQMIWMLNHMQGAPEYELPLKMIFARAGILLEEDAGRAKKIAQGLSLLMAEEYLPKETREQLYSLEDNLELYQLELITLEDFQERLSSFLRGFIDSRRLLVGITS